MEIAQVSLPTFHEFARLVYRLDDSLDSIVGQSVIHQRWLGYLVGKMHGTRNRSALFDLFHRHAPEMKLLGTREHLHFTGAKTPSEVVDSQLEMIESRKLHHFDFFCLVDGHNARLLRYRWTRLQLVRLADAPGYIVPDCLYGQYLERGLGAVLASSDPLRFSRLVREVYESQDESQIATLDLVPATSLPRSRMVFNPEKYYSAIYAPIVDWLIRYDLLIVHRTMAHARHPQVVDCLFTRCADIQRLKKSLSFRLDEIEGDVFGEADRVSGYTWARRKFDNFTLVLSWIRKHVSVDDFRERSERIEKRFAEIPERAPRRSVVRRLVFDDGE